MMYKSIFAILTSLFSFCQLGLAQNTDLEIITDPHVTALYRNSGNPIKILKPVISDKDKIEYSITGANVIRKEDDPSLFIIVPRAPKVKLELYRDSVLIGRHVFNVRLIPEPTLQIYANNNLVGNTQNESISRKTEYISVIIKPEEYFQMWLPLDAKYTAKKWTLTLLRNNNSIDSLSMDTETADIKKLLSQSKSGDIIHIEVRRLIRTTFLDEVEDVNWPLGKTIILK